MKVPSISLVGILTLTLSTLAATPKATEKAPAEEGQKKAAEIINHYIKALGGTGVMEAIKDRTQKFRNTKHAATGDTVAALNQYIKDGYKVREEWNIEMDGQSVMIKDNPLAFTQVYNGSEGWVQMFGTVSPLEGRTLSLFVWDKFLDDPLCHWEEDGYTLEYLGTGTVNGESCDIVGITDFSKNKRERLYFSTKSGLLLKKEWKEQGQKGLTKKEIFYKKYRAIPFSDNSGKKYEFALLHEVYGNGDLDTTREFKEVMFNSGLKDSIFDRPEGVEFKGAIGAGGRPQPGSVFDKGEKAAPPAQPEVTPSHPPITPSHPPIPPASTKTEQPIKITPLPPVKKDSK